MELQLVKEEDIFPNGSAEEYVIDVGKSEGVQIVVISKGEDKI